MAGPCSHRPPSTSPCRTLVNARPNKVCVHAFELLDLCAPRLPIRCLLGGAIAMYNRLDVSESRFEGCQGIDRGGVISVQNSIAAITGSFFGNNTCEERSAFDTRHDFTSHHWMGQPEEAESSMVRTQPSILAFPALKTTRPTTASSP